MKPALGSRGRPPTRTCRPDPSPPRDGLRRWVLNRLLARWIVTAIALLVVASAVPGFHVSNFVAALLAALVIGLANATLGLFVKIITLPLTILTLGLFLLVVNALMIELASWFVPGFSVRGFAPAFWGALILALINIAAKRLLKD
jgi:putative membrane protein